MEKDETSEDSGCEHDDKIDILMRKVDDIMGKLKEAEKREFSKSLAKANVGQETLRLKRLELEMKDASEKEEEEDGVVDFELA